jgi:hypothetical protein
MKMKSACFIVLLSFFTVISSAQETRQMYLGIETGMTLIGGKMSDMDFIRGEVSSYPIGSYYSTNHLTSLMYQSFVGIKSEFLSLNNKIGFSGGIRFTQAQSSIGKSGYWASSTNYFYLLYKQDGINTEYLKVKEIKQSASYLGIPVEIRYFPFTPHLLRPYFKLGAEIGFLLQSKTEIGFKDDAMEMFQEDVVALIEKPEPISSSFYGSCGIRLGRESKPWVSFEICLPALYITSGSSGLVNPISGGGFQLNAQIPINPKAQ